MDAKELIKWGALALIGFLAFRWAGSTISGWMSGGVDTNPSLNNAAYAAPLPPPSFVYAWTAPWQRGGGRGGGGRGRYGPGKRYGGPHDR